MSNVEAWAEEYTNVLKEMREKEQNPDPNPVYFSPIHIQVYLEDLAKAVLKDKEAILEDDKENTQ